MKLSNLHLHKDIIFITLAQIILFALLGALAFMAIPDGIYHLVPSYLFSHLKSYLEYVLTFDVIYYSIMYFYWYWLNECL